MPLGMTIMMAYFPILPVSKDRIIGAPGWVWNDKYDVVGKVGEGDLPAWQKISQRGLRAQNPMLQTMLQNALADRCKIAVHRVPTQIDGYALVIANHGPNRKNLVESKPDDAIPDRAMKMDLNARIVPIDSHDDPVVHLSIGLPWPHLSCIEDRSACPENTNLTSQVWERRVFPLPIGIWLRWASS